MCVLIGWLYLTASKPLICLFSCFALRRINLFRDQAVNSKNRQLTKF